MLDAANNVLLQSSWMAMWPGIAIFLVVIGCNLFGESVRETRDPRQAQ
jgi:peptide/nickel transport system permease protein